MGDRASILIVDSNVGFATMLQESLEQEGEYRATVAHRGSEALEIASDETFDLAIVDLGIEAADDLDGAIVARRLRQRQGDLRLMLIPLEGDVLSDEVADLDVQSVLPKPFFLPDLPGLIEGALTQPMAKLAEPGAAAQPEAVGEPREAADQPETGIKPGEAPYAGSPDVFRELEDLAREINAEAVLLTHDDDILASVGRLSPETVSKLAQITKVSYESSNRIAEVLGRERQRFEQSVEGGEYMLYSLTVVEDVILSAALPADVALGIVRHRAKTAAKHLRDLVSVPS
jgi:CheY-like chemotaxis protein